MKRGQTIGTVLKKLERKRGKFVSGEEIGGKIGISRAAIWKAIKSLQRRGYDIECVTHRGYSLKQDSGMLSEERIKRYLSDEAFNITVFEEVESTNDIVKQLGKEGAPEWTVVAARKQTSGKGRMGRTFESPEQSGVYFSVLLKPNISALESVKITTLASVAVSNVIERLTKAECKIKWVNDIYMKSKKVCGILTEAGLCQNGDMLDYAVLGIGINITTKGLSPEVKKIAGGIGLDDDHDLRNKLTAAVLDELKKLYDLLGSEEIYNAYKLRSFVIGQKVSFVRDGEALNGVANDIAKDYSLIVETSDGETLNLNSGEISVKL